MTDICPKCGGASYARLIDYRIEKRWVKTCKDCGFGVFPEAKDIDELKFRIEETALYAVRAEQAKLADVSVDAVATADVAKEV